MLKKIKIVVAYIGIIASSNLFAGDQNVATLTDIKESLSYLIDYQKGTQNRLTLLSSKIKENKEVINENKIATDENISQLEVAIKALQDKQKHIQWAVNFSDCTDLKLKEEMLDEKIVDFIRNK